ncbi:hypothetical protein LXL04_008198 [Taraxacum kok-saghyz]
MVETELESYLNEPPIKYSKNFDILSWWKLNGLRYPIVAQMAKDILGIQISTVASESTFSTGRRVITDYHSNLFVGIVEALISTADWTRKSRMPIMDNVDDILNDDDVALELEEAIHNNKAMGKRPRMNYTRHYEVLLLWVPVFALGCYQRHSEVLDAGILNFKRGRLKGMAQKSQLSLKQTTTAPAPPPRGRKDQDHPRGKKVQEAQKKVTRRSSSKQQHTAANQNRRPKTGTSERCDMVVKCCREEDIKEWLNNVAFVSSSIPLKHLSKHMQTVPKSSEKINEKTLIYLIRFQFTKYRLKPEPAPAPEPIPVPALTGGSVIGTNSGDFSGSVLQPVRDGSVRHGPIAHPYFYKKISNFF